MDNQMERVEKVLTSLILEHPFFATLAMRLKFTETDEVSTFATDGKNMYINKGFCSKLSKEEIKTVIAHEVMHCAMGHLWRMPTGANPKVWNMAVDNETNWELEEYNVKEESRGRTKPFKFPSCGAMMENRFRGQAAEKVYRTLIEEYKDEKQIVISMGEIMPVPHEKKSEMKEEWERAVVQSAKMGKQRGRLPGSMERLVEEMTSNKVDWRTILRDCLTAIAHEDWSFRKANARYADSDFILPSLFNERVGSLVFAIDTSGSITNDILNMFISEAQMALDELSPEFLEILFCDTAIRKVSRYEPGDIIKEKTLGGGGTDFRPVFKYCNTMENFPKVVVYMTDLYGSFPDEAPEYPVIWLTDTEKLKAPFGETIKYGD